MREWTGKIVLAEAWALFVGNGGVTPMHEHLAYKIVIGLDGPAQVAAISGAPARDTVPEPSEVGAGASPAGASRTPCYANTVSAPARDTVPEPSDQVIDDTP